VTSRQSAGEADKLVRRYLAQLDAALRDVDASRREEILAEVHGHIEEGRTGLDPDDAASVRTLLDKVGDPAAIAAEAGAPPPGSRRWDAWAPWLIIFGPVASGLGWIAEIVDELLEERNSARRHRPGRYISAVSLILAALAASALLRHSPIALGHVSVWQKTPQATRLLFGRRRFHGLAPPAWLLASRRARVIRA